MNSAILGLVDPDKVATGYVVRMPKAYPVLRRALPSNVADIVEWLDAHAPNVHPVGRNGMHRYNNQDHSMYTAMLTAANIATGATTTSGTSTSRRTTTRSHLAKTTRGSARAGPVETRR